MDIEKKERTRSRSSTTEDNAANEEPENKTASDVNGESANAEINENVAANVEENVSDSTEKATDGAPKENVEKSEEHVPERSKSKKRKASEAKTGDESASEESVSDIKEAQLQEVLPKMSEKDDSSANESSSDLSMPPKQTLGKGKRARIPNKRYSDILLSPQSRSHKSNLENGDKYEKIEPESDIFDTKDEEIASMPAVTSLKSRSNTSSPASKRPKYTTDVTDVKYRKPFIYGWKRELVYRATSDNPNKRNGDIYYYTPAGKKVRSMREVSENLKNKELSLDNFTFFKEPLGLNDPEKEIIRDAKAWNKKSISKGGSKTPKVLSPKISSPKVVSTPKAATPKVSSPKAAPTPVETPSEAPATRTKTSTRSLGNIKNLQVKLPPSKTKADKKAKVEEEPMEVEPPPPKRAANKKAPAKVAPKTVESPRAKRRAVRNNVMTADKVEEPKFMDSYLQNLSYGYNTLLYVFQYLKVQDLLRAGCVCTMWRDIASHPSLWRTVRMKNSQVHSFEGLANSLQKHGTVHLDLRKMLLPTNGGDDIWPEFSKAIEKVQTLRKIELCRCPASVVEQLAVTNKDLEVVNAVTIKCESMSLDMLSSLTNLKELRLKSTSGLTLSSDITSLKELTSLTHLSLTSIKDLNKMDLHVIAALRSLESLDLGECSDFPTNFGEEILIKLKNLEKLRLEKGQGNCHTFEILDAVQQMPQLEQLELVNFDIKTGFDVALGGCRNIRKLLIIPTYISQSATTNHMVLGGVLRLQSTLSHFVWGVTLELLRVTELFVDQCEDPDKKEKRDKKPVGNGDSIPVLKPVPLITDKDDTIPPAHDPPQVEILPLPNLQKLLLQSLPTTRVKILKIPFHATWRQSITDTVN
jgi:hypothetical protein